MSYVRFMIQSTDISGQGIFLLIFNAYYIYN